jgi:hypothetical protein
MITTDYNTTSTLYISAKNSNDGWGFRVRTPKATNAISHSVSFFTKNADNSIPASTFGSKELDFQMQIKGNTIKIWIGKVGATFNDSNVNYVMEDYYNYYTTNAAVQNGTGSNANTVEGLKAATPKFATDGNVIVGVPFFYDSNGKLQVRSLNIKQS